MMQEAGGRVQSIEKAVKILEILAETGAPMPLREIATVPCTHCGGTGRTERKNADA